MPHRLGTTTLATVRMIKSDESIAELNSRDFYQDESHENRLHLLKIEFDSQHIQNKNLRSRHFNSCILS